MGRAHVGMRCDKYIGPGWAMDRVARAKWMAYMGGGGAALILLLLAAIVLLFVSLEWKWGGRQ